MAVELGLRPEWILHEMLSLHTQLGVSFVFGDTNSGTRNYVLLLGSSVLAQAGATVWF